MLSPAARGSFLPSNKYKLTIKELILWILARRKRFNVTGDSMLPLLKPNQDILIRKTSDVAIGDIVVVKHPHNGQPIVKQVVKIDDNTISIQGLNPQSTDSRDFGSIPKKSVIGILTVILSK